MNRWHSVRYQLSQAALFCGLWFLAVLNARTQTNFPYHIPATGPVLYDGYNQRTYRGFGWDITNEAGNEIVFSPKGTNENRTLGSVYASFCFYGNNETRNATARLRLYQPTEPDTTDSPPGLLLFDSGPVGGINYGFNTLVADGQQLTNVPDRIIWTLAFNQLLPFEFAGLVSYDLGLVGFCFNDYWERQSNGWACYVGERFGAIDSTIFGARFLAYSTTEKAINYITHDLPIMTPVTEPVPANVYRFRSQPAADTNRLTAMARFQLSANSANEGVVSIAPYPCEFYPVGTALTMTASPAPGCYFSHWSDGSTNPVYTLTLDADSQLPATFGVSPPSVIHFQRASKSLTLRWDSSSVLQQATTPSGPWVGAAYYGNPVTIPISGKQQYFRLRSGFGYE